jgi:Protein of unknown function (DUF2442)
MAMMSAFSYVTAVEVLDGHRVRLAFEDGSVGDVDLTHLLSRGPVFEPLRDPAYFRQVRVDPEGGTIVWPNGADVAPETLYAAVHGDRLSA